MPVPVTLHLDHCPDRSVITDCLDGGWNSVLFDAHELDVAENLRQTTEVVAEARRYGAHVEGEIEGIQGVEDGVGSDDGVRAADAWRSRSTSSSAPAWTASPRPSATRTASTRRRRRWTPSG